MSSMSLKKCIQFGTLQAREDGATHDRQSPVTVRASPGRSLAERQLDRPRALSSRLVSARAKVSSSDYCEEMMNR